MAFVPLEHHPPLSSSTQARYLLGHSDSPRTKKAIPPPHRICCTGAVQNCATWEHLHLGCSGAPEGRCKIYIRGDSHGTAPVRMPFNSLHCVGTCISHQPTYRRTSPASPLFRRFNPTKTTPRASPGGITSEPLSGGSPK